MKRILFVCLGNICRSPAAEGIFSAKASAAGLDLHIDSAGTAGWHIGKAPYPPMISAAGARGFDLTPLRARQAQPSDFMSFDLIVAMDRSNLADLEALRPPGNTTKLRLFLDGEPGEVPDPYYTRDFDGALDLIEAASDTLIASLISGK